MSWNKDLYSYKYKRPSKFDHVNWIYSDYDDEVHWENYLWNKEMESYDEWGAPKSMGELHQYKLLTLLHLINLKDPMKIIDQIGWY